MVRRCVGIIVGIATVAVAVVVRRAGTGTSTSTSTNTNKLSLGFAECDPLEQPQQVPGRENGAEGGNHHEDPEHVVIQTGRG